MFRLSSIQARAMTCGVVALIAFHPCFAPVSSEPSPSEEAERRIYGLNELAFAHWHKGDYAAARSAFEEAIRIKPEPADIVSSKARRWVQTNLAWLLATCPDSTVRDGSRAVALAEPVVASAPKDVAYRDTLAAAYAEAGRFEDAVNAERQALASLKKGDSLRDEYQDHLKSYTSGKPWRDSGLQQGATPATSTPARDDFLSSACVETNSGSFERVETRIRMRR